MRVTNKYNLPPAFYNALARAYQPREDRISVTHLIDPPLIRRLLLERWNDIEVDASERLWMLLGSAIHYVLEQGAPLDSLAEEKLTVQFGDITLVGVSDLWHQGTITDYKITSVWAFILGEKPNWERQGNVYRWMYHRMGFQTDRIRIDAILRDWQRSKIFSSPDYPPIPFASIEVPLWSLGETEVYIESRLAMHRDPNPPPCTDDERWGGPPQWAVMKEGQKRAVRVFDTKDEALALMRTKDNRHYLKERRREYRRCLEYCTVRSVCPHNPYRNREVQDADHDM